jgi:hypothetical protein
MHSRVFRSSLLLVSFGALFCSVPLEAAVAASISLFSDSDCSSCNLTVPAGSTRTLYIKVLTEGLPPYVTGIVGAEFKVTGLPPGWMTTSTPNPASHVSDGDPFGPVGTRIAFPQPQPGTCILLFTVSLTATTPANDVTLQVTSRTPPSDPNAPCPNVSPDCTPNPCPFAPNPCVDGGTMFINSSKDCTIGVAPATWSAIRVLYRE